MQFAVQLVCFAFLILVSRVGEPVAQSENFLEGDWLAHDDKKYHGMRTYHSAKVQSE